MIAALLRRHTPPTPRRYRPRIYITSTWQPTPPVVDPGPVQWQPPTADLILDRVLRRYGDSPADRAARMLRHIAAGGAQ